VEVKGEGQVRRLSIAPLVVADGAPAGKPQTPVRPAEPGPPPGSPPADRSASSSQRTVGYIVGGAGVVALGVSGFFALRTASKNDESKEHCASDDANLCTSHGLQLREQAQSAGNVATAAGLVGLAALGTGVVLVLTAPDRSELQARVGPGSVQLTGSF
jgi:hypothetical protein